MMWETQHRAGGFRITKCFPSAVLSVSRHFASGFSFLSLRYANDKAKPMGPPLH